MSHVREPWTEHGSDDASIRLLRLAGPRPSVPAGRAARVRDAVHADWRIGLRRAVARRRAIYAAGLATAAAALMTMAGSFDRPRWAPVLSEQVALVERIQGSATRVLAASNGASAALVPRDSIRTGDWIETDAAGRVAIRFADGTSVRLDVRSRVRPLSSTVIELASGAVYVDSGDQSRPFEVRTPLATARDIGTQFEVRLLDAAVRLRVRTGTVELTGRRRSVSARAGTEITFSSTGAVSRPIPAHGSMWAWTIAVAPKVDIDGIALGVFLERMAREHGWSLRFADEALGREAARIILHGSVASLPPHVAVEVAILTSGLHHRFDDETLVVLRGSSETGSRGPQR